jgi:esterase/lipase
VNKIAIIIHGYPQTANSEHPLVKILEKHKYKVIKPYLFEDKIPFSLKTVLDKYENLLNNVSPDLIIGISMGGLIAPFLAQKYPKAKLVLIATGNMIKTKSRSVNFFIFLATTRVGSLIINFVQRLPQRIFFSIYRFVSPNTKDQYKNSKYIDDAKDNLAAFLSISPLKHRQIAQTITKLDTLDILRSLRNETLIITGTKDVLMPEERSELLAKTISKSKLVKTPVPHFDTINENTLKSIQEFIL